MHFAIRYLTEYRYDAAVTDNLNALRVKPATTPTQRVDDFGVRIDPESRLHQHLDYFGTTVIEFGVSRPHDHLSIDVRARVKTSEPDPPPDLPWAALAERAVAGLGAVGQQVLARDGAVGVGLDRAPRRVGRLGGLRRRHPRANVYREMVVWARHAELGHRRAEVVEVLVDARLRVDAYAEVVDALRRRRRRLDAQGVEVVVHRLGVAVLGQVADREVHGDQAAVRDMGRTAPPK